MLIYNKQQLDNLAIRKTSARWFKGGMLSAEEHEGILKKYPVLYKESGIFAKIGMFVFTVIILGCSLGLFCFVFLQSSEDAAIKGACIFFGISYYAVAEYFVRANKYVRSGVLDALLYTAIVLMYSCVILMLPTDLKYNQPVSVFTIMFPLIAFAAWRFADAFLALAAFAVLLIINGMLVLKAGSAGRVILPFETMALSFLIYYIAGKQSDKERLRYWKNCFTILEIASLTALYLSGNYMAIRKLTESLLDATIGQGQDIMMAPLFYAYTIIVPLVYIWLGLKRKNYVFNRLGLLLLTGGVLSIKYYHSFMPPETAMILSGTAMIMIAYFCMRYFKIPKHGITLANDGHDPKQEAITNIANMAISQVMAHQPHPAKPDEIEFGGGDFGGGGAGSDF